MVSSRCSRLLKRTLVLANDAIGGANPEGEDSSYITDGV
jgi:hypothetical protein